MRSLGSALLLALLAACGASADDTGLATGEATSASGGWCVGSGFCWESPTPQGTRINGVARVAANDAWAVGDAATLMRFDGTAWSRVVVPQLTRADDLRAIWAASASDVWVVGSNGKTLHFDGHAWTIVPTSLDRELRAVWGSAPNDVWAASDQGDVLVWNGTRWSERPTGTNWSFNSISGTGPDDVWITATANSNVHHWDGAKWDRISMQPGSTTAYTGYRAVHAFSKDNVWFGGNKLVHWTGGHAYDDTGTNLTGRDITALSATEDGRLYATTTTGDIVRVDTSDTPGAGFGYEGPPTKGILFALNALDARGGAFLTGGEGGRLAAFDASRQAWNTTGEDALAQNDFRATWSNGTKIVAISGLESVQPYRTGTFRFDGAWASMPGPPTHTDWTSYQALGGTSDHDLWAVGNACLIAHWDGSAWKDFYRPNHCAGLNAVWAASPNDAWAAGENGDLLHWDGASFEKTTSPGSDRFRALWGSSASDVWLAGNNGAYRFDGTSWTHHVLAKNPIVLDIWGTSASDVWFVGLGDDGAYVAHWDGQRFARVPSPAAAGQSFTSIRGDGHQVWVAGSRGYAGTGDLSGIAPLDTGTTQDLSHVEVAAGHVRLFGKNGAILAR
jgi:hypothetical protein